MREQCNLHWLGVMEYEPAWRLQDRLAAEIAAGQRPPTLLLLEHPHTYTFGRRGHPENLLWDPAELERRGVSVHWVDRGGDVTYHGPGQLVGYPLLPLAPLPLAPLPLQPLGAGGLNASPGGEPRLPQADYIGYLRRLEETLITALACLGVAAQQIDGLTGVWVQSAISNQPSKIAAIGVKVDARGVTRHGFALNVAPDMTYWEGIIGCGLKDATVTSLAGLLDPPPTMAQVRREVVAAFGEVFGYEMVESPLEKAEA
jgi:lipoate-protein ligase B